MTIFPFIEPTDTQPFQISVLLDGQHATLQVKWNLYGQRYYIHVIDSNGNLLLCTPMISGGNAYPINLSGRAFTDPIVYNIDINQIQIGQ